MFRSVFNAYLNLFKKLENYKIKVQICYKYTKIETGFRDSIINQHINVCSSLRTTIRFEVANSKIINYCESKIVKVFLEVQLQTNKIIKII